MNTISMSHSASVWLVPSDTCFGIACSLNSEEGYRQIYALKGRSFSKPLAFVLPTVESITEWAHITPEQIAFLRQYPRPFTLLARPKDTHILPPFLDVKQYVYIGIRIAEYCLPQEVLGALGVLSFPLFLTSANASGESETYTLKDAQDSLGNPDGVCVVLDAPTHLPKIPPSDIFSFIGDTCTLEYRRGGPIAS